MAMALQYRMRTDDDDLFIIETAKSEMDNVLIEAWGRPVDPAEILDVDGADLQIIEDSEEKRIGFYSVLRPNGVLYLNTLILSGSAQGKGYGTAVMQHLESLACQEQRMALELSVQTTNHRAIHFYKKLGFEDAGWVFYRTTLMRKILPE